MRVLVRVTAVVFIGGLILAAALAWWTQPRLLDAGDAALIVEGHEIHLTGEVKVGTGIAGTLGLVNGRCVGFVDPDDPDSERGTVIVWPPGTSVEGSDDALRITSEGNIVRLGDEIEAGADLRRDFPELESVLPNECRGLPMVPVGLNS